MKLFGVAVVGVVLVSADCGQTEAVLAQLAAEG